MFSGLFVYFLRFVFACNRFVVCFVVVVFVVVVVVVIVVEEVPIVMQK